MYLACSQFSDPAANIVIVHDDPQLRDSMRALGINSFYVRVLILSFDGEFPPTMVADISIYLQCRALKGVSVGTVALGKRSDDRI